MICLQSPKGKEKLACSGPKESQNPLEGGSTLQGSPLLSGPGVREESLASGPGLDVLSTWFLWAQFAYMKIGLELMISASFPGGASYGCLIF